MSNLLPKYLGVPANRLRSLSWRTLRLARLDGPARTILGYVVPSEHLKILLQDAAEKKRQQEVDIVRGLGTLTLVANSPHNTLKVDLTAAWQAAKRGTAGVTFEEVFDAHEAAVLEAVTPPAELRD